MEGGRGRRKRNIVKNKGGAQMVIVSTIKEISYFVVSLLTIWWDLSYLFVILSSLAGLFALIRP